ncbi:MAG: superoxide dismutase [Actinobacteria bacterium]|nr:superoxide dismutase [Actinomycetota bacterium]
MTRSRLTAILGALALVVVAAAAAKPFPEVIELPNGWRPDGIEAGRHHTLYVGSIPTGAIRQIDARTGESFTLVEPISGRSATGLEYDERGERLFVAGGGTGQAYVYDAESGAPLADYLLTPDAPRFINDVVLTRDAVYFTDSMRPWLYRLSLGRRGALPSEVETIPLSGDYVHQPGLNLNGIEATRDGRTLIAVQTSTASLFKIEAATGAADRIELTGGDGDVAFGDGLLLEGRTLYVVQNRRNRVAVIRLSRDLGEGTIVGYLTHPALDVPTTIDRVAGRLYLPNARFGIPEPDAAAYQVVNIGKGSTKGLSR